MVICQTLNVDLDPHCSNNTHVCSAVFSALHSQETITLIRSIHANTSKVQYFYMNSHINEKKYSCGSDDASVTDYILLYKFA